MNNHYIAKIHTKPWEIEDRRFFIYKKSIKNFLLVGENNSKHYLAQENIYSDRLEKFCKIHIEGPLNHAREKLKNSKKLTNKESKALWLLFMMQAHRFPNQGTITTLEKLIDKSDEYINKLIMLMGQRFTMKVHETDRYIHFPNKAYFQALPIGSIPVIGMPLSTTQVIFIFESQAFGHASFSDIMNLNCQLTSVLSLGNSDEIIITPETYELVKDDVHKIQALLQELSILEIDKNKLINLHWELAEKLRDLGL